MGCQAHLLRQARVSGGRSAGCGAEGSGPWLPREQRLVEHCGRSRLDEGGSLVESATHSRVHRAERARDEAGDQARCASRATHGSIPSCGSCDTGLQHRRDVLGVLEPAGCHHPRVATPR